MAPLAAKTFYAKRPNVRRQSYLICPTCELNGIIQILGKLDSHGGFLVQRFHQHETRIFGTDLRIQCGACGETVFERSTKPYDGTHLG